MVGFRLDGVDLIPDPIGWVIAASALSPLHTLHRGFGVAGVAAWLAVIPSLPDWFGVESTLIVGSTALALLVVQFASCSALMVVRPVREPSAVAIRGLSL